MRISDWSSDVCSSDLHLGDLAQGRVRLLRGGRVDAGADTTTLRAVRQRGRIALVGLGAARLAHQLVDRCHSLLGTRWLAGETAQIGRASCRERVVQYV